MQGYLSKVKIANPFSALNEIDQTNGLNYSCIKQLIMSEAM